MKNGLLTGIQGSGKGVQLDLLKMCYPNGLTGFSSGGAFRAIKARDPDMIAMTLKNLPSVTEEELVSSVTSAMSGGSLDAFDFLFAIFEGALSALPADHVGIWDGMTRNREQARRVINELYLRRKSAPTVVFQLELSEEVALDRIAKRAKKIGRDDDMKPEAVRERLNIFNREHLHMINFFRQVSRHLPIVLPTPINGSMHPRVIAYQIQDHLGLDRVQITDDMVAKALGEPLPAEAELVNA